MQNIIIFNQSNSIPGVYGIGTFVKLLIESFKRTNHNVYVIELNSKQKELLIKKNAHFTLFIFPIIDNSPKESQVIDVLNLYIDNISESVVFFNNMHHLKFAEVFKVKNPQAQHIGIIHYFSWMWPVQGRERDLENYLSLYSNLNLAKQMQNLVNDETAKFSSVDMLITLSQDSYRTLRKIYGIDSSQIIIIPNAIKNRYKQSSFDSIANIKQRLSLDYREKIVLYVGRLDAMKGVDVLVSAFKTISQQIKNCRLIVIGDGDFQTASTKIASIASKITFTGRVDHKDINIWYQIADVGVMPSYSEECSFVGIEMMMHGLPIVASNGRGVRNMFHHMQNCLRVNCWTSKLYLQKKLSRNFV